jgi:hypothetical protein
MTVATTQYRISYSGNGSTTAFSFPYVFFDGADLTVILVSSAGVETTQTITTDYAVSGGSGASGTVTMVAAPAAGETLVIVREQPFTQTVLDLVENDPLPSATLEEAIDRTVIMAQQNSGQLARALRQPEGDTVAIERLPASGTRATKVLAFDADGDPVASTSTLSEIESGAANAATSASAAAGSAADAATAKTAAETAQTAAETAQGLAETAQAAAEAATSSKANDDLSNVDPATGRTALGLVIGTDVQAQDALLDDIAGLTPARGEIFYFDGTDIAALGVGTSGQVLQTQGAGADPQWADAAGGGKILQVLQTTKTDTASVASQSVTDITGLSQAITLANSANKVLVMWSVSFTADSDAALPVFIPKRDSTELFKADAASNRVVGATGVGSAWTGISQFALAGGLGGSYLDTPGGTGPYTYKIAWRRQHTSGTAYLNRTATDTDSTQFARLTSSITLFEVDDS